MKKATKPHPVKKLLPTKGRLLVRKITLPSMEYGIIIPEKYRTNYGRFRTGAPIVLGHVLAVGEDVTDELSVHDLVLIHPLNIDMVQPIDAPNNRKDLGFCLEAAVLARFTELPEGVDL